MSFLGKFKPGYKKEQETAQAMGDIVISRSLWVDAARRFRRHKLAVVSSWLILLLLIFVIVTPILNPWSYSDVDWDNIAIPPSSIHWFGTDENGRDLLARVAFGGRISLAIGVIAASVAIFIGTIYGAISGFVGGKLDIIMMRIIEILDSLPYMFLVIMLLTLFGRSIFLLFVALGIVSWLGVARVVRGMTLSIRRKEFIDAAQVLGLSNSRIVLLHIVPNLIGVVIVYASLMVPGMIMFESFLSFLGLGVQEPLSSWGSLISDGSNAITSSPWMLIIPSFFLSLTLICFNYIGDGLRDALDPKDR